MGNFEVRSASRVVIYERKLFIRLATGIQFNQLNYCCKLASNRIVKDWTRVQASHWFIPPPPPNLTWKKLFISLWKLYLKTNGVEERLFHPTQPPFQLCVHFFVHSILLIQLRRFLASTFPETKKFTFVYFLVRNIKSENIFGRSERTIGHHFLSLFLSLNFLSCEQCDEMLQ